MIRRWSIAVLLFLLCGCGERHSRMDAPADPQGLYHDQIAIAKRLLDQKEPWAERADWEVLKCGDGWKVIAWRVEHPERKGASRYLPWGYSVINLDHRLVPIGYSPKG